MNPILRSLSLAENLLYVCPLLPELLENNHVITVLNLSGNKIRDDTIRFIGPALKKNLGIVSLNLNGIFYIHFLSSVIHSPLLRKLINFFIDNELTTDSLLVFSDVLDENQMLTSLLLQGLFHFYHFSRGSSCHHPISSTLFL